MTGIRALPDERPSTDALRVSGVAARPSPGSQVADSQILVGGRLLERLDVPVGSVVQLRSASGEKAYTRLAVEDRGPEHDDEFVRLGRLMWTQLTIRPGESVSIQPVPSPGVAESVHLRPAFHLFHHLGHRVEHRLREEQTVVWPGATLFVPVLAGGGGVVVRVEQSSSVPGVVGPETRFVFESPDAEIGRRRVTLAEVGGLDDALRRLRDLIELPLLRPALYRSLGVRPPRGVVLHGPPGTGKTLLSQALASELAVTIKKLPATELVGAYSGETEANLRALFDEAAHHAPTLVVIDEIDVITTSRGRLASQGDIRATTQLLTLMDGLDQVDGVVLLATTNRIEAVDEAFRRPGRFDEEIYVGPPDASARREILSIHSREMPLTPDADAAFDEVSGAATAGFTGADLMHLVRETGLAAARRLTGAIGFEIADQMGDTGLAVTAEDVRVGLERVSPSAMRGLPPADGHLGWHEIDGLEEVKSALLEAADAAISGGAGRPEGVLLTGASGNGKSALVQALCAEVGANYVLVDGSTVFTQWLGESEAAVRALFRKAQDVAPAIVVLEHLDAVAPRRSGAVTEVAAGRVLSALLSSVDEVMREGGILVIGVTDRPELIEPALTRAGRLGLHLEVDPPDERRRRQIVSRLAGNRLGQATLEQLVTETGGANAAEVERRVTRLLRNWQAVPLP